MLLSRSMSMLSFSQDISSVFVLLVDSQYGGVVNVEVDVNKMEIDVSTVYDCVADWIMKHCCVSVSPINRIWNKLRNANWGDIGVLQLLFATFHSIVQYAGLPKLSIDNLAANRSSRLQTRRVERQLGDAGVNGNMLRYQQWSVSPEIVEVKEESVKIEPAVILRLEV
ncbi:hypothetical protein MLD38_020104 [Melastoma candidum]|uniref:Uncharacterized protein n=1 Tax=Melastoma candidum TaxID=119954 RepID=A0ACB9QFN0_9MYRT|nr:hypothetical protein MLD38_020104 [Melastoma candidum]